MKVKLICGFLAAGETTFVKKLLRKYGKGAAVFVNDFGSTCVEMGGSHRKFYSCLSASTGWSSAA